MVFQIASPFGDVSVTLLSLLDGQILSFLDLPERVDVLLLTVIAIDPRSVEPVYLAVHFADRKEVRH